MVSINIYFDVPDELKHSSGIYEISNNVNNKVYVGRTKDFKKRYLHHKYSFIYLNGKIKRFIDLNPDACFTFRVLEVTNNLKRAEEYWIRKLNSVERGFNKFHSDEEFMTFNDGYVYLWKLNLKKIVKERKTKEPVVKKVEEPKKKNKKEEEEEKTIKTYPLGLIIINGKEHDLLGNEIR